MSMRVSFAHTLPLVGSLLTVGGCAVTTPAPRFTAVSPADPAAAEGAVPPPAALLTGGGELSDEPTAPPSVPPEGLTGHFSCPMHPEVAAKEPGQCPKCGMTLVRKAAAPKERR